MSEKRLIANRQNAQRSTGPKTESGKKRSRLNATKHGAYSTILIQGESAKEQRDTILSLCAEYSPHGLEELMIVREIADTILRKQRYKIAEGKLLEAGQWADFGKGIPEKGDLGTSLMQLAGSNGGIATVLAAEANLDRRLWSLFDRLRKIQERRKSLREQATTLDEVDVQSSRSLV